MTQHDANETGSQQRINERLLAYWEGLRTGQFYPREKDIDFHDIEPIWASCFLVKRDETLATRFAYIYLGSDLIAAYGDDLNQREICERLVFPSNMSLLHKFDEVVTTGAPVEQEGEFTNTKGLHIRYRSMMLPLGNDDNTDVQFIIGGMRWKAYL
jgi:hypothetical protein